jgi:hypothetical protein
MMVNAQQGMERVMNESFTWLHRLVSHEPYGIIAPNLMFDDDYTSDIGAANYWCGWKDNAGHGCNPDMRHWFGNDCSAPTHMTIRNSFNWHDWYTVAATLRVLHVRWISPSLLSSCHQLLSLTISFTIMVTIYYQCYHCHHYYISRLKIGHRDNVPIMINALPLSLQSFSCDALLNVDHIQLFRHRLPHLTALDVECNNDEQVTHMLLSWSSLTSIEGAFDVIPPLHYHDHTTAARVVMISIPLMFKMRYILARSILHHTQLLLLLQLHHAFKHRYLICILFHSPNVCARVSKTCARYI